MGLAEAKAGIIYKLNRSLELVQKPIKLVTRDEVTLESARAWDREKGNFAEAATDYYSVYLRSDSPHEDLEALFGLTQEMINLGKLGQARKWLGIPVNNLRRKLGREDSIYLNAKVWEQRGWINDIELGFGQSVQDFSLSKNSLPQDKKSWGERERILTSTDTHFIGRAYFGLAGFGIERVTNLRWARKSFEEALKIDQEMFDEGKVDVDKMAFGYSWIARCHMRAGDLVRGEDVLEKSTDLFRQHVETTGREGVMAYPSLLRGELMLIKNNPNGAKVEFEEAIRLRKQVEPYSKGLADAYLGMAAANKAEGNWPMALSYLVDSFKAHPYTSYRGMMGG